MGTRLLQVFEGETSEAIQVTTNLKNPNTKKRELRSLIECLTSLNLNSGIVVNEDLDYTEEIEGKTVRFIPLWKWLIQDDVLDSFRASSQKDA